MAAQIKAQVHDPLHSSRRRTKLVDGRELRVPRHIARLDGERLAGWQVRWDGTRYFSDSEYGGPDASLKAACEHLRRVWYPVAKQTNRGQATINEIAGIRTVRIEQEGRGSAWYVEAFHPRRGQMKRFYCGTDTTTTPARQLKALRAAKQQRQAWLDEIPVPIR